MLLGALDRRVIWREIAVKLPTFPNLEGLIGLARQDGVDVRPTLVRVLTDMYVQRRGHSRDEEHRYTELALWLLSCVDHATRAAVARKLSTYPETPRAVARLLAADEFDIAEPVLRHSPSLNSEDLLAIAVERGSRHADAIAARPARTETAPPALLVGPRPENGPEPIHSVEGNAGPMKVERLETEHMEVEHMEIVTSRPPRNDAVAAASALSAEGLVDADDALVGERFLAANAEDRRMILAQLAEAKPIEAGPPSSPPLEAIARLEAAALDKRPDDFAYELQKLLRVSRDRAQDIVDDPRGEPVVIAARAIGMPADVLLRVLLFLNPAIGESVERVFDLMEVHYQLTPQAARRLVAGWHDQKVPEKRVARHQSVLWDDEAASRRGGSDVARRSGLVLPDGRSQPARTGESTSTERRQRKT